jgi:predicted RNase H-like HicB family nuclease
MIKYRLLAQGRTIMQKAFRIIVEKHPDGYVTYPLGLKGVVVGEGDTYEEALTDVKSAIGFHIETFGPDVIEGEHSLRSRGNLMMI